MTTRLTARASGSSSAPIVGYTIGHSMLGPVLVAETGAGAICSVLFGDNPASLIADLAERFPAALMIARKAALATTLDRIVCRVNGDGLDPDLLLDMGGTVFQRRVWWALRTIPSGQTASYREIAARIDAPKAVRAVARACSANRLAVLVPCHRVVRADGGLSGYRWGTARKRALLTLEAGR